jgi:hypothetical protein
MNRVEFLILDVKEKVTLLELSTGWKDTEWGEMEVEPGMYLAELAINPVRSCEEKWFFVKGSRIGQRVQWLVERKLAGVQIDLLEATNGQVSLPQNIPQSS